MRDPLNAKLDPSELAREARSWEPAAVHDYIGDNYIGHNHIGHHYIGHNYIGRGSPPPSGPSPASSSRRASSSRSRRPPPPKSDRSTAARAPFFIFFGGHVGGGERPGGLRWTDPRGRGALSADAVALEHRRVDTRAADTPSARPALNGPPPGLRRSRSRRPPPIRRIARRHVHRGRCSQNERSDGSTP